MAKFSDLVRASVINSSTDPTLRPLTDTEITTWNNKAGSVDTALTGAPTAPTQAVSDDSTKMATTAFVNLKIPNYITNTVLTLKTGSLIQAKPTKGDSSLKIASTSFVAEAIADYIKDEGTSTVLPTGTSLETSLVVSDNSNKVATTAFVKSNLTTLETTLKGSDSTTINVINVPTGSRTIATSEIGKNFSNAVLSGSGGAVTFTLPAISASGTTPTLNSIIHFTKCNVNNITIKASGTNKIMDGNTISNTVTTETLATLTLHAIQISSTVYAWVIRSGLGTWTTSTT
jgi:hypothetical protein